MRLEIPEGTIYGKLRVLGEGDKIITPSGQTNRTLKCICECGKIKCVRVAALTRGKTKSCGCTRRTMNGESRTPIGKLYHIIRSRCSPYHSESHLYYDKGVRVCKEWADNYMLFKDFCLNNGYEEGLQIDRIDGNKGYSPDNCRFVTAKVNSNNRENTFYVLYEGQKEALKLLLHRLNYPNKYYTVRARLLSGWDVNKAIFKKPATNYSARRKKTP